MQRIWNCVLATLPRTLKFAGMLLVRIIPISLVVRLLQYFGVIDVISGFAAPLFSLVGLPGEASLAFITSCFLPLYPVLAVLTSLPIGLREATIIAVMCLTSHNLPVECAVLSRTGSAWWKMVLLRVLSAFALAFILNLVLPADMGPFVASAPVVGDPTFGGIMLLWFRSTARLCGMIMLIVYILFLVQAVLEEFGVLKYVARPFEPLMAVMGLPRASALQWIVGNTFGILYGGAMLIDQVERGAISRHDANLMNWHLAISHSLLEDTILFVTLGVSAGWLIIPRLLFAIIVVWCYRGVHALK